MLNCNALRAYVPYIGYSYFKMRNECSLHRIIIHVLFILQADAIPPEPAESTSVYWLAGQKDITLKQKCIYFNPFLMSSFRVVSLFVGFR